MQYLFVCFLQTKGKLIPKYTEKEQPTLYFLKINSVPINLPGESKAFLGVLKNQGLENKEKYTGCYFLPLGKVYSSQPFRFIYYVMFYEAFIISHSVHETDL